MTLETLLTRIQPVDEESAREARARHDQLTKPPGSLGELETLAARLAGIHRTARPRVTGRGVAVFAADHGIADAGVSAYPKEVTEQMIHNLLRGGAAINALAGVAVADLLIVDVGVDADLPDHPRLRQRKIARGTRNFLDAPAMTAEEATAALLVGVEIAQHFAASGTNLVAGGEIGIGNSTAAAALTAALTGRPVREVTGRGTGLRDEGLERKRRVIDTALQHHQPNPADPLAVLQAVGGLEIAALAGFYLGAAAERIAVVLDGFIATSAALVAAALEPKVKGYLFASHRSQEPGHGVQLEHLGLVPLFDLGLRLGEGTGAVLALPVLESAAAVLGDMATFDQAGVATKRP